MTYAKTNQELSPHQWPVQRQIKNQAHAMTCTKTNQELGPYQWPVLRQIKNQAHTNDLY